MPDTVQSNLNLQNWIVLTSSQANPKLHLNKTANSSLQDDVKYQRLEIVYTNSKFREVFVIHYTRAEMLGLNPSPVNLNDIDAANVSRVRRPERRKCIVTVLDLCV